MQGASEILPWLYLGDKTAGVRAFHDTTLGVARVLNVVGGTMPSQRDLHSLRRKSALPAPCDAELHLMAPMCDYGTDELAGNKRVSKCLAFLAAPEQSGDKVLCHCRSGVNRSVTIVILFLMEHKGWTLNEALHTVQRKRMVAYPHPAYLEKLMAIDRQWFCFLRLPLGCRERVLTYCSEPTLRAFRCAFRDARAMVHDAHVAIPGGGQSARVIQRAWRHRLFCHYVAHARRKKRRLQTLEEVLIVFKVYRENWSNALDIHRKFELELQKPVKSLRRLRVDAAFLNVLLDPKHLMALLMMCDVAIDEMEAFLAAADGKVFEEGQCATLDSTVFLDHLIGHYESLCQLLKARLMRLANEPKLKAKLIAFKASMHPSDLALKTLLAGRLEIMGGVTSVWRRIQMLVDSYLVNCGPAHLDLVPFRRGRFERICQTHADFIEGMPDGMSGAAAPLLVD